MKVGIILPGFSASESDWCIPAMLSLVRRLQEQAEVHVFPLRYPDLRRPYTVYGAVVHPLGGGTTRGLPRLVLLRRAAAAIAREHRRAPFDALHGIWADEPGLVAVAAGWRLGVRSVVSLTGGELVRFPDIGYGAQISALNRLAVRLALRGADHVAVGSSYIVRLAEKLVAPGRLVTLPIGVDEGRFRGCSASPAPFSTTGHALLHVASLVPVKGQPMLLRAVTHALPAVPDLQLHIVGDGPERERLAVLARSLAIDDHVTFHGAVSHERLPDYYRAADLCVLASRHEAQELVTLEAAVCGRATIGTAVGLVPDLAPGCRSVPVGDDHALGAMLVSVLTDPEACRVMGEQARALVLERFTLTRTVEHLIRLYTDGAPVR